MNRIAPGLRDKVSELIPLRDQEYIRAHFSRDLVGTVTIDYFTQRRLTIHVPGREECVFCEETQQVLKELAGLSDRIRLNIHEFAESTREAARHNVERVPAIVLRGVLNRPLKFYGFPGGGQFPVLVESIVDASRGKVELTTETVRHLRRLKSDVSLRLFVTPTCPHCPALSHLVYNLALESPRIQADVVEISEFPRLAERMQLRAVPITVIDGRAVVVGTMDEQTLISQIVQHVRGKAVQAAPVTVGETTPFEVATPEPRRGPERRESGLILP